MFDKYDVPSDFNPFELVSSSRRLLLLRLLFARNGTADLWTLSREIVARESGVEPEALDRTDVLPVYVTLAEQDVPALENRGLVEYDDTTRVVSLGDRATSLVASVGGWQARRRAWVKYYLVLAGILATVVFGYVLDVGPLTESMVSAFTIAVLLMLVTLASIQFVRLRSR